VIVVIELGLLAFVISGMTVRAVAGPALAAPQVILRCPLDVVGDEQIEPSVFVVVEPSGAGGPSAFIDNSGFGRDIGESAVAIVVIKDSAAVASYVQIGKTVVVEISDGDTLPIMPLAADTGFLGDIRKRSVAIVAIERAA